MKFAPVLFLSFLIYFFSVNSAGANGGQANQQQNAGSVTQPFWAARGRRGGDIGPFLSDNDNNAVASVNSDEMTTFDKLSKTRPIFPLPMRGFPGLGESVLTKEDYYNPKWRGVSSSSLFSPEEMYWYLVSKRNGHNSSPPDLPFWAARGYKAFRGDQGLSPVLLLQKIASSAR